MRDNERTEELLEQSPRKSNGKRIKGLIIGVIIIVFLSVLALTAYAFLPKKWLSDADTAFAASKYDEAISDYEKVLKWDKDNLNAYLHLSETYLEKDDAEQAIRTLKEGITEINDTEALKQLYKKLTTTCEEAGRSDAYMKDLYQEAYEKTGDAQYEIYIAKGNQTENTKETDNSNSASAQKSEHRYEFYIEDITWQQANQRCQEKGGHLVTFDTDSEFQKVINLANQKGYGNKKFYIGGRRTSDGRDYKWIDQDGDYYGSSINNSSNWLSGEPSYYDSNQEGEAVNEMYMMAYLYDKGGYWVWVDVPNNVPQAVPSYQGKVGYICEYDE